jgi:triosephosphate isomerase (TIM)
MKTKALVANWKMHLVENIKEGFIDPVMNNFPFDKAQAVICAPYISVPLMNQYLDQAKIQLGVQSISEHDKGAYTGEVSAQMAVSAGAKYTIVGHSERRAYFFEDDNLVYQKALKAQELGLTPIVCIGENLDQREADLVEDVLTKQLALVLAGLISGEFKYDFYLAYEPIWAIGTGVVATVEQIAQAHGLIRSKLESCHKDLAADVKILYGGSLKPGNAAEILVLDDVDGGLIGGASLNAEDYLAIAATVK